MANNNSGCFVPFMKLVILLLFIGGVIFMIGREFLVHDYTKVVQNYKLDNDTGMTYKDMFDLIFIDGRWEQREREYSDYPDVIYTGKHKDENGETHNIYCEFGCKNDLTGFIVDFQGLSIDGEPHAGQDGAAYIRTWYLQAIGLY